MEPGSAIPSCPMEKPQSKVAEGTLVSQKKKVGWETVVRDNSLIVFISKLDSDRSIRVASQFAIFSFHFKHHSSSYIFSSNSPLLLNQL